LFPGLSFRLDAPPAGGKKGEVLMCFASGKVVLTGFKHIDNFKQFFYRFERLVLRHKGEIFW